jgi:hypothetical protein
MKNLYLAALLLAFPFILLAQNIHGLWSGTLVNDSTHRMQNFELGLSEYRGKITGYTYTTFIENDTFYYSVKRIKAERKDGKLVIEDVEMVGNNFPERAAKHVKQITTFPLINDTTIDISNGRWSTTQTKKYYSINGSAKIKEQEEEKESDLLAHLQEMKVKNDIAVNKKEKKDEPIAKNSPVIKHQTTRTDKIPEKKNTDVVKNSQVPSSEIKPAVEITETKKADETKSSIPEEKKTNTVSNSGNEIKENNSHQNTKQETVTNNKSTIQQIVPVNTNKNDAAVNTQIQTKVPEKKQVIVEPVSQKTNQSTNNNSPEKEKIVNTVSINTPVSQKKESIETMKELPAAVAGRKNESIQDIYFKNDSLVLSLYDNGIVDGDTVSVFMNGENIISKQKLKEAATKKTIYIPAKTDSVQLVLFAENLGAIPPNTGLLTVRDGDDVYQVRFSADLQKNASIFLRRKKE